MIMIVRIVIIVLIVIMIVMIVIIVIGQVEATRTRPGLRRSAKWKYRSSRNTRKVVYQEYQESRNTRNTAKMPQQQEYQKSRSSQDQTRSQEGLPNVCARCFLLICSGLRRCACCIGAAQRDPTPEIIVNKYI